MSSHRCVIGFLSNIMEPKTLHVPSEDSVKSMCQKKFTRHESIWDSCIYVRWPYRFVWVCAKILNNSIAFLIWITISLCHQGGKIIIIIILNSQSKHWYCQSQTLRQNDESFKEWGPASATWWVMTRISIFMVRDIIDIILKRDVQWNM